MEKGSVIKLTLKRRKDTEVSYIPKGPSSEEADGFDVNAYSVPNLMSVVSACVLEDLIDQLTILGNMGELPTVGIDLEYRTIEEKCHENLSNEQIFDPATIMPYQEMLAMEKFFKFQKDRSFVEKVSRGFSINSTYQSEYENTRLMEAVKPADGIRLKNT